MPTTVALLSESSAHLDVSAVAVASLAAFLQSQLPALSLSLQALAPGRREKMELALQGQSPGLLVLWLDASPSPAVPRALSRLRVLLPSTPILLAGPLLVDTADVEDVLARLPELGLAIRGEPELPLKELCQRLLAGQDLLNLLELPPGVSLRTPAGVRHGPALEAPLPAEALLSPYESGFLSVTRKDRLAHLEVARGPLPFSPLSLALQPGAPRAIPLERLRRELGLLLAAEVPMIRLVGGPIDLLPDHFRGILDILRALNRRTLIQLDLERLPDETLAPVMHGAGVGRVTLQPAWTSLLDRETPLLDRVGVRRLTDLGLETVLKLPLGLPGESLEGVRRRLDPLLGLPLHQLDIRPLSVWPGHPLRRTDLSAPESGGMRVERLTPYQVVETAALPLGELLTASAWGSLASQVVSHLPLTFRLLQRTLGLPPTALLEKLLPVTQEASHGPGHLSWRTPLLSVARGLLVQAGKVDRFPLILASADYDEWVQRPPSQVLPPKGTQAELEHLQDHVLAHCPGVELRTFPYDLIRLSSTLSGEDAPLRRTHIVVRRAPGRPPQLLTVSEYQRVLFESVDGRHTVGELLESLRQVPMLSPASTDDLLGVFRWLLGLGLLYVRRRVPLEPPTPQGNILAFRSRPPHRPPQSDEP